MSEQTYTEPAIGGADIVVKDVKHPKDQQALVDLMAACPHSWQGDEGFKRWCEQVYAGGAASVEPPAPPAPVISAINPASVTAGATDVTVVVVGTGFGDGAVVTAAGEDQETSLGASAKIADSLLAAAGTVALQVRAADGVLSNAVDLTVS